MSKAKKKGPTKTGGIVVQDRVMAQPDISSGEMRVMASLAPSSAKDAIDLAKAHVSDLFKSLSAALERPDLTPGELAHFRDTSSFWGSGMKKLDETAKARQERLVREQGQVTSDKGSMELVQDGYRFPLRPKKTGYDDRKVEAMLRAKGLDPSVAMHRPEAPYETDVDRLEALAKSGGIVVPAGVNGANEPLARQVSITEADLAACKHELEYAVLQPEKVQET